jgi:hypothetical protein
MSDTKFCIECGSKLPSSANFCLSCGAQQETDQSKAITIRNEAQIAQQSKTVSVSINYPVAKLLDGVDRNLYQIPNVSVAPKTTMSERGTIIVFARDAFEEWLNVFYLLPTGEGTVGWAKSTNLSELRLGSDSYPLSELLLSDFTFNDKKEINQIKNEYGKRLLKKQQKAAFRGSCLLFVIGIGAILGLAALVGPAASKSANFVELFLTLIVCTFLGMSIYSIIAQQRIKGKSPEYAEQQRLAKIANSKKTQREIEMQDKMTLAAFGAGLGMVKDMATDVGGYYLKRKISESGRRK